MAETEKPKTSRCYNKNSISMDKKVEKSFESLAKKMNGLTENELGKLKGGISVVQGGSGSTIVGTNTSVCVNNGDCSGETNSGTCHNFPGLKP